MRRQEANLEILELLKAYVENNDWTRFGQLMSNLNLSGDQFYEESTETLKRLKKQLESK